MKEGAITNIRRAQAHVWTLSVEPNDDAETLKMKGLLSADEVNRFDKIAHGRNRREYIAAHALTRVMLSSFCNISPADWRFEAGKHGRPELAGQFIHTGLRFNLSHAKNMVACAVTVEDDIGVGVEWVDRPNDFRAIAEKKFSLPEVDYFANAPEEDQRKVFFSFWTLKESYIKAIGKGLAEPLDGFAFNLDPLAISFLRDNGEAECWAFDLFGASPVHFCAISVARPAGVPVEIFRRSLNWHDLAAIAPPPS